MAVWGYVHTVMDSETNVTETDPVQYEQKQVRR